ncbi:putative ankyrin repeat protein, partial [Rhexocercosporidium sp. MPI-PUGE-AT-0058]
MAHVRNPNLQSIDELRRWLQPTEYLSPGNEYMKHLKSYVPGTGDWLRDSEVFRSWEDEMDKGCLWVRGVAGSGKSVFAAATIKSLADTQDSKGLRAPVLFFFFRQIVEKNHDPKYLIRDWVAQLLPYSLDLQQKVNGLSAENIDGIGSSRLWDVLVGSMKLEKKVYCIADALDEMDDQHVSFIIQLKELGTLKPESIKVMLTSRPTVSIESQLRQQVVQAVKLEPIEIYPDIVIYVSSRLASLKPRLTEDKEIQVKEAVCMLSKGLFLYARLLMDSIADGLHDGSITPEHLPTAIEQLPRNLTELYERLLSEHARRSKMTVEQQLVVLQCVTQSSRPMRLIELGSVVSFLMKDTSPGLMEGKEAVKQACGRFLELLDDETISVIHHSFTEFAMDRSRSTESGAFPILYEEAAHRKLLELCLQYLQSCEQNSSTQDFDSDDDGEPFNSRNDLSRKEGEALKRLQDLRSQYPLMAYAAGNLAYHMVKTGTTTDFSVLDQYFVPGKNAFQIWMMTHFHEDRKVGSQPLHFAASHGLTRYIEHLLLELLEEQLGDDTGQTPLQYACQQGNVEILNLFIPQMNVDDACKGLRWTVESRKRDAAEAIIKTGKAPIDVLVNGVSPLVVAADLMDAFMIEALLRNGADPSVRAEKERWYNIRSTQSKVTLKAVSQDGPTPIHAFAGVNGDNSLWGDRVEGERCLKLLVEAGGHVNAKMVGNHTPLHYAVKKRQLDFGEWDAEKTEYIIAELLLQHGADPNLRCASGATALHKVDPELPEVIDLLVRHGADVNAKDNKGTTPLLMILASIGRGWSSSFYGENKASKEASVFKLIEHGADVTIENEDGWTALHYMFSSIKSFGNEKLWKAVIEAGADLNKPNKKGRPPLLAMSGSREGPTNEQLLRILVEQGLELTSMDTPDKTILFELFDRYDVEWESFEKLIQLGCSAEITDSSGATLLHRCIQRGRSLDILKGLVRAGADPRVVDNEGNTLFHELALSNPSPAAIVSVMGWLLEMGVEVHARNLAGRTPLHIASATEDEQDSYSRSELFMDWLLNGRLCPPLEFDALDNLGASAIHYAASFSETHVGRLLRAGADPTLTTNEKLTPLHIAARGRQSNVIALLLWEYQKRGILEKMLDANDDSGRTALHYACRSGRHESVHPLIAAGSSLTLRDKLGRTPVHAVAEYRNAPDTVRAKDIVEFLESAGADFEATIEVNKEELTLMDLAVEGNCIELVNELRDRGFSAKRTEAEALIQKPGSMKEAKELLGKTDPSGRGGSQIVSDGHNTTISHAKKFAEILQRRDYSLFEEFVKIGGDLKAPEGRGRFTGLHELVEWGHASLLAKYSMEAISLDEQDWMDDEQNPGSLLCHACEQSLPRLETIKVLVEKIKVDVNYISDRYGYTYKGSKATALHWLSTGTCFWNIEAIEYLLDHGADIEARNKHGGTPLMTAVCSELPNGFWKEETMEILLQRGANPNLLNSHGKSCLNMADHANAIRLLLKYGADVKVGSPAPLTSTIKAMDIDGVELLLQAGANPNQECALHVAARPSERDSDPSSHIFMTQKQRAMISLLLEYGADPFALSSDGSSVIQMIIEAHGILDPFWDVPDFPVELRGSGGRTPLISACYPLITPAPRNWSVQKPKPKRVCYLTAASRLLDKGASVGAVDDMGRTALHWMCTLSEELDEANQALFTDLVSRSPESVNQHDHEGFTPLQIAFANSHTHKWITEVLISCRCDPMIADPRGNTVLHYLAPQLLGKKEKALPAAQQFRHFLSLGVPINHRNNLGETATFPFMAKSWKATVGWCNNRSISNYARDNDISHVKALPIFLEAGADLQVRNNQGRNLLHVTAERWRKKESWRVESEQREDMLEIFKELMRRGIDPRAEDKKCRTAIDVAV